MIPFDNLNSNSKKVQNYFGNEFMQKSFNDSLNVDEVIKANKTLENLVYGQLVNSLIQHQRVDDLEELHEKFYNTIYSFDYESNLDLDKIGAILVRPEVYQDREKYKEFLQKIKLRILFEKKVNLSFERYWMLYHEQIIEGLKMGDPLTDFATRTFNYIKNDSYLYLVESNNELNLRDMTVADYLFKFKGKQGCDVPNTLRGDIAYNSLKPYIEDGETLKKCANLALDPIGIYRMLVRGKIYSDRCHSIATAPILFYSGQAVHIPNRKELQKDLNMFCNQEDIKNIQLMLSKK